MLPAPQEAFGSEWVELYNPGAQPIATTGWLLDDDTDGSGQPLDGLVVGPGELVVVELSRAILNNSGDTARLLGPDGGEVDALRFERARADRSYSRDLATGALIGDTEPSPLAPQRAVGPSAEAQAPQVEEGAPAEPGEPSPERVLPATAPPRQTAQGSPTARPTAGRPGAMPTYAAAVAGVLYTLAAAPAEPAEAVVGAAPAAVVEGAPAPTAPARWPLAVGLALIVIACGLLVADREPL